MHLYGHTLSGFRPSLKKGQKRYFCYTNFGTYRPKTRYAYPTWVWEWHGRVSSWPHLFLLVCMVKNAKIGLSKNAWNKGVRPANSYSFRISVTCGTFKQTMVEWSRHRSNNHKLAGSTFPWYMWICMYSFILHVYPHYLQSIKQNEANSPG